MSEAATNQTAMDKVDAIQCSLRCFVTGLFGLLPVLGLPFAIVALANYFKLRRGCRGQWNPAQRYVKWGVATALCGTFLTIVITIVLAGIIILDLT